MTTPTIAAPELVAASQFRRCPHNREPHPDAIERMHQSIREVGVLQPITARPMADPATGETFLEIVMGECRWLGCCRIDPQFLVPVFVRPMDEKEAAKLLAVENFQRKDLDPIEEARALKHMKETGWSVEEIAESVGRSKESVWQSVNLLKLPASTQEEVRAGTLGVRVAVTIATLPPDRQEEATRACLRPTTSAHPLTQREALDMLRRNYVEPMKREQAWRERRHMLENEHDPAEWCEYERAVELGEWDSGYASVFERPAFHLLARWVETAPTWGELAARHGARRYIGLKDHKSEEAVVYVETDPLIEAEKAAHRERPHECIFPMHAEDEAPASEQDREARRREEAERRGAEMLLRQEVAAERAAVVRRVLDGLCGARASKALAAVMLNSMIEAEVLTEEGLGVIFPDIADGDAAAAEKYAGPLAALLVRCGDPIEAVGRLIIAHELACFDVDTSEGRRALAAVVIGTGALPKREAKALAQCAAKPDQEGGES